MLGQGLAGVIHNDVVLSRPDTRNLARAWMVPTSRPGPRW